MILTLILFFTLFFAPFIITAVVKDPDERSKYMKIYAFIFIGSFFIFPIVRIIDDYLFSSNSKNTTETVADGFTIEGYEVILDVGLDNKIYVTENIDINFYESGHHGIYKFTPFWLEYTGQNNKTLKRKSQIYGYHAEGDEYTVDYVNKKERIKIGSPYQTVYGDKKYTIKYIYDMGKDPYNGFDEFIFHAFGDFWGTRIKNPKVIIHMPKSIGNNGIKVFKDKYRKDDITNLVKIEKDGNTITIDGNNIFINKSLTVDVSLPEGYFVGVMAGYQLLYL